MRTLASTTRTRENTGERLVAPGRSRSGPEYEGPPAVSSFPAPMLHRKASCACGGGCPACQAKSSGLKVSRPDDPEELEADRIADTVMRMPEDQTQAPILNQPGISRTLSGRGAPVIQAKGGGDSAVLAGLSSRINSSHGGNSLDRGTLSFMQRRFGEDFSGVKIHADNEAFRMSRELNAKAFTVGKDIYFNEGEYRPSSDKGKRLLAHELAHTMQQKHISPIIQRDVAVEETSPEAVGRNLTRAQMRNAIRWNRAAFSDADEISLLRDVLGISAVPAVIDEDFVNALVQYQANYRLTQDGLIGSSTARRLADQLRAEAAYAGADADVGSGTEMALSTAQRRMRLRSRVVGRLGRMRHQGFIGPRDHPTGIATVRSGFINPGDPTYTNAIGINYTGSNVANSRWLQFGFQQMSAVDTATRRRVYNSRSLTSTAGTRSYSSATNFHWGVDTVPAAGNMYYESGGTNERTGTHTEIFDQPRFWNTEADTFAASFATRPARVRLIVGFDTYLVVNNNSVVYHVRWNIYFNFNTSVAPTPDVAGTYEVLTAGPASRLPANLKTALNAQFPGNTVP